MKDALRRKLFYLCRVLGIDEDTRHLVQHQITGHYSTGSMNNDDAIKVINHLEKVAIKSSIKINKKSTQRGTWHNQLSHAPNVYNLMTREQRQKITALSMQLYSKFDEASMDRFCRRQFKKPFNRLSSDDAIKLIEIQKDMLKRRINESTHRNR